MNCTQDFLPTETSLVAANPTGFESFRADQEQVGWANSSYFLPVVLFRAVITHYGIIHAVQLAKMMVSSLRLKLGALFIFITEFKVHQQLWLSSKEASSTHQCWIAESCFWLGQKVIPGVVFAVTSNTSELSEVSLGHCTAFRVVLV